MTRSGRSLPSDSYGARVRPVIIGSLSAGKGVRVLRKVLVRIPSGFLGIRLIPMDSRSAGQSPGRLYGRRTHPRCAIGRPRPGTAPATPRFRAVLGVPGPILGLDHPEAPHWLQAEAVGAMLHAGGFGPPCCRAPSLPRRSERGERGPGSEAAQKRRVRQQRRGTAVGGDGEAGRRGRHPNGEGAGEGKLEVSRVGAERLTKSRSKADRARSWLVLTTARGGDLPSKGGVIFSLDHTPPVTHTPR